MKVDGFRAVVYPLSLRTVHKTLGSAYSDTASATVKSCSRQSQYVKSWIATNWINLS